MKNGFFSLSEAKRLIEQWRKEYNCKRPHTALNELTPNEQASLFVGTPEERECKTGTSN